MAIGDKVYVVNDPKYIGTIDMIRGDQARVRWHKGYATWEDHHMLRAVGDK